MTGRMNKSASVDEVGLTGLGGLVTESSLCGALILPARCLSLVRIRLRVSALICCDLSSRDDSDSKAVRSSVD